MSRSCMCQGHEWKQKFWRLSYDDTIYEVSFSVSLLETSWKMDLNVKILL